MQDEYTAVYCQDDGWVMAYLEELPQVASQGRTIEEARINLTDAYQLMRAERQRAPGKPPKGMKEIAREELTLPSPVA